MPASRRTFLAAAAALPLAAQLAQADEAATSSPRRNRIAVSTYSFWQFRHRDLRDIEKCIDLAAEMGFDGVEILHRQMESEDNGYLQRLKRRAFVNGLDLCGFSTHQGFLSPDATVRQKNIDHTIHCIELAYAAGHSHDARQHRHLGHEQELRRADEEPRHRAAARRLHRRGRLRLGDRQPGKMPARRRRSAACCWAWRITGAWAARRRACCGSSRRSTRRGCR